MYVYRIFVDILSAASKPQSNINALNFVANKTLSLLLFLLNSKQLIYQEITYSCDVIKTMEIGPKLACIETDIGHEKVK